MFPNSYGGLGMSSPSSARQEGRSIGRSARAVASPARASSNPQAGCQASLVAVDDRLHLFERPEYRSELFALEFAVTLGTPAACLPDSEGDEPESGGGADAGCDRLDRRCRLRTHDRAERRKGAGRSSSGGVVRPSCAPVNPRNQAVSSGPERRAKAGPEGSETPRKSGDFDLPVVQGRQDSNLQPPVLETGALPIAPRPWAASGVYPRPLVTLCHEDATLRARRALLGHRAVAGADRRLVGARGRPGLGGRARRGCDRVLDG